MTDKKNEELLYADLAPLASELLAKAGWVTINERRVSGQPDVDISVNDALGMATRVMVEQSYAMAAAADAEEAKK